MSSVVRALGTLGVLFAVVLGSRAAWAAERDTAFKPEVHGFNFTNTFNNDVVAAIDVRTGGLCGGMVYSALDYFRSPRSIPRQDYRPANATRLQSYLYQRQVQSIVPNVARWANMGVNPGGSRNSELFVRGVRAQFKKLRTKIDRGHPVPLGLHGVDNRKHQVLAIGYETDADGAPVEIRLYDPNFRNEVVVMRPNHAQRWFEYVGKTDDQEPHRYHFRTYFTDTSYSSKKPPSIATPNYPDDGKIREMVVKFKIGDDDLRGGDDNVDMLVHLRDGTVLRHRRINLKARWLENYDQSASVKLTRTVARADIKAIEFQVSFGGGVAGDNWDTEWIDVTYYDRGNHRTRLVKRSKFYRFTGDRRSLRIPVPGAPAPAARPDQVTKLLLKIHTGFDDLRGNEDNVHAIVLFADGTSKRFGTVNKRKRWADNTTHSVWLDLGRGYDRDDIVGIRLETTFKGGFGSDEWKMQWIDVIPHNGDAMPRYAHRVGVPLKHFTSSRKTYTLRW